MAYTPSPAQTPEVCITITSDKEKKIIVLRTCFI